MKIKYVFRGPAGDDGDAGGGAVDRGDSIVIDTAAQEAALAAQAEKDVADAAAAKAAEEAADEAAKAEPARDPDTGKFVPKARLDEQVGKERLRAEAAERRAAELEAKLGQVSRSEDVAKLEESIAAMEKNHAKLLLDGQQDEAAKVMKEIRLTERRIALQQSQEHSTQISQQTREEIKMDFAIERLESKYDQLNPASEIYNQDLVEDVLGWQSVYMERYRLPPSQALTKAADYVMSLQKEEAAPTPAPAAKGLGAGKADTNPQVVKNLAAAAAQPANLKDSGMDSDKGGYTGKIDINNLTPEEFDALPASKRAELRGDLG